MTSGCLRLSEQPASPTATPTGGGDPTSPTDTPTEEDTTPTETPSGEEVTLERRASIDVGAQDICSTGSTVFLGRDNEVLRYDIGETAERVWRTNEVSSRTMAVVDGELYTVSLGTVDPPSTVARLSVADGSVAWSESQTHDGSIDVRPVVTDTAVLVPDSSFSEEDEGVVHAYERSDGTERWRVDPTGPDTDDRSINGLALLDDVVVVSVVGQIVVYDRDTGTERTRLEDGNDVAVFDGLLIVSGAGAGLKAVDPASGDTVWTQDGDAEVGTRGVLSVHRWESETVTIGRGNRGIFAVRAGDGTLLWSYETFDDVQFLPVLFGGFLWFIDRAGYLHGVRPGTGEGVVQRDLDNLNLNNPLATVPDGLVVPTRGQTDVFSVRTS